jgi:protein-S-isoprenylcysteine O-methyltransferase Ste14
VIFPIRRTPRTDPVAQWLEEWFPRLLTAGWFGFSAGIRILSGLEIVEAHGLTGLSLDEWVLNLPLIVLTLFNLVLTVLVLLRRRPIASAEGLYPRCVAFLGTFLFVLIISLRLPVPMAPPSYWLSVVSFLFLLIGGVGSLIVILWLGRSFSIVPQARRLVIAGPYRWVRHPLYLVEEVLVAGTAILYSPPYWYILLACHLALQIERMRLEEEVLRRAFPEYAAYAARTARLIPGVY